MIRACRAIAAGWIVLAGSMGVAGAVETDAPQSLITAKEAIMIAVRQKLDGLPSVRDQGETSDRAFLASYYSGARAEPLWVEKRGLTDRADQLIAEMAKAGQWGLDAKAYTLPPADAAASPTARLISRELHMSLSVLRYARHARGGRMDPKQLSFAIDRTPPLEDPAVVLSALEAADDPASYLRNLHPKHEQFELLRQAYLKSLEDEKNPAAAEIDLPPNHEKKSRRRKSKTRLSKRLLYNMEMWRWMPLDLGTKYVWSNIPEYRMRVVKAGRVVHAERIVTGKVRNKTPIFSDEMETIVFHPFWGVPNSIKVKEILPSLARGGNILERQNLRIQYRGREVDPYSIDWSTTDIRNFHVFQPPGRRNALGIVKFMFPNKHAIYMHDTPTKHLFKKQKRAFSHGCMRVRNPLKLAEVVLSEDRGWGRTKIDALVKRGPKNNQISLNTKIPVHVTYFTARIDEAGKPVLFEDIYGHEKLIQKGLDGKAHLIVKRKPNLDAAARNARSAANGYYKKKNTNWIDQVFGGFNN